MTADPILSVRGLTAKRASRVVATDVDIDVFPGDRIYIWGENGSGKTTLLESLLGLLPAEAQSQRWLDRPGTPLSARAFLTGAAVYVRQHNNLFASLTLSENLMLGRTVGPADAEAALAAIIQSFPELGDSLGRLPPKASAGQRQMAAATRILMHRPRLFVLDEPTAGLAAKRLSTFYQLLADAAPMGCAVLFTEQHDELARGWATKSFSLATGALTPTPHHGEPAND